jgi:hypothetical protein
MNNVAGTNPVQWTDGAGGANLAYISDPVLTAFTLSGTITNNIRASESNNNDNISPRVRVYKYSGGAEGSALSDTQSATELTTSESARNWTDAAPTSTNFAIGDRIVVKVFADDINASMTAGTASMFVNGAAGATGDSYVEFTEAIALTRTRTVKSSGGDYTTLSGWEAGEQGDLPTLLEVRQAELYSFQDTTAVTFAGWTTDATHYVNVFTPASERSANGVYDTAKYRLETTTDAITINNASAFFRFDGLQIKTTVSSGSLNAIGMVGATVTSGDVRISNSNIIAVISGTTGTSACIAANNLSSGSATIRAWNNVIHDFVFGTVSVYAIFAGNSWTADTYNNTVYNCRFGYQQGGTATFISINNAAMSCNDGFNGTFDASSDYNASDIASDAPGANAQTGSITFVNAAGGNFQPAYTDTVALGNGTTDPGAGLFSDDITGAARAAPWDIGAFKAQAAPISAVANQLLMIGCGT